MKTTRLLSLLLALSSGAPLYAQEPVQTVTATAQTSSNFPKTQSAHSGTVAQADSFSFEGYVMRSEASTSLGAAHVLGETKNAGQSSEGGHTQSISTFKDRLLIVAPGREGQSGVMRVRLQTNGSLVGETSRPGASADSISDATLYLTFEKILFGTLFNSSESIGRTGVRRTNGTAFLGREIIVNVPFTFGNPFVIEVNLSAVTRASDNTFEERTLADGKTFWTGVASVTNSNGAPISNYTLTSDSGVDYKDSLEPRKNLWAAGDDLLANEKDDVAGEGNSVNATVPQWRYGFRSTPDGTAFTPFTPAQHQNGVGHPEVDGWIPGAGVLVNTGSVPVNVNLGGPVSSGVRPGQLLMQPTAGQFAVARWTAPEAGTYNIAARWVDVQNTIGNGAAGHVVVNGAQIFGGQDAGSDHFTGAHWANGGKIAMAPRSLKLTAGTTIDFVVGANGDASGDLTALNAVVRRAPAITIAAPATATAGANVVVRVTSPDRLLGISLQRDGLGVGTDETAPYEFVLPNVTPGIYQLQAEGVDMDGVRGASNVLVLTVNDAPVVRAMGALSVPAAAGATYECLTSGVWSQADIWRRKSDGGNGVPGPNDIAILPASVQVVLDADRTVKKIYCEGILAGRSGQTQLELTVTGQLGLSGLIRDLTVQIPVGGVLTNVRRAAFFENVNVINHGQMVVSQSLFAPGSSFSSTGSINLRTAPASAGPVVLLAGRVDLGGLASVQPGTAVVGAT
ncbi:MAG TPA: hypothetical protein VK474_10185, partial [Chthoniobacterales bacterium]|nr:hypothetical protein [Chthoniobacterales bacterium]